jgi:hypothetical protein
VPEALHDHERSIGELVRQHLSASPAARGRFRVPVTLIEERLREIGWVSWRRLAYPKVFANPITWMRPCTMKSEGVAF